MAASAKAAATSHLLFSRRRLLQGIVAAAGVWSAPRLLAAGFTEIAWDALVPPDWDPMKSFRDLQKLGALPDSDSRVQALYDRMRKVWDEAPMTPRSKAGQ